MKGTIRLTKNEIKRCEDLFNKLCDSDEQLDQELAARFDNATEIRQQIEKGVDDFYQLYREDIDEDTIRKKIAENMSAMDAREKYSYLANLMVAMTHICGNVFEGTKWNDTLKDHETVLSAIELGLIDDESEDVIKGIEEMQEMIAENIEAFAVLFVDDSEFEDLQEACMNEDPEQVQALAVNTREASVNMAAAIYILQEDNELPSLGQTRYTPHDVGVMSASLLEIDAAQKSGSLEKAKSVFAKASRTAVTLLVASPAILTGLSIFGIIALLTNFATIWLLVSGVILGINLHVHMKKLEEHLEPVFKVGAKVLNITLGKVQTIYRKVSTWVHNTIVPAGLPIWERCRDFTLNHILIPSAAFLIKIKDKALSVADPIAVKAKAVVAKMKAKVQDLFSAARNVMEQNGEEIDSYDEEIETDEFEDDNTDSENISIAVMDEDEFENPIVGTPFTV